MTACPPTVTLEFLTTPPNPMYAMRDYQSDYRFAFNITELNHVPNDNWHIPHANIHSCYSNVGFCTPFVGNTPGLRCASCNDCYPLTIWVRSLPHRLTPITNDTSQHPHRCARGQHVGQPADGPGRGDL